MTSTIFGACIYYWGHQEQTHLLREGVWRWAVEARQRGLAERLWYSRFDAGGPHVMALFATSADARGALDALLRTRIDDFLRASPSQAALRRDELDARHRACRGKILCTVHRDDGVAANNSFVLFDHEPDGYPVKLGSGMRAEGDFWRRMGELSLWTLGQLESGHHRVVALRWLAAVDRALRRRSLAAERYWRLHATTLVPSLAHPLDNQPQALRAALVSAIGERNRRSFAAIWSEPDGEERLRFDVDGIVSAIVRDDGRPLDWRFAVLREVNHCVLSQVGLWVNLEVPMVLDAWQRNLSR